MRETPSRQRCVVFERFDAFVSGRSGRVPSYGKSVSTDELRRRGVRHALPDCWPMSPCSHCSSPSASIYGDSCRTQRAAAAAATADWSPASRRAPAFAISQTRYARQNRGLRSPPAPRGRPQGHLPLGRCRWRGGSRAGNLPPWQRGRRTRGDRDRRAARPRRRPRARSRRHRRQQVRQRHPAAPDAAGRQPGLPRLPQAGRCPDMRISGWTCQGGSLPAQRAAIVCMLNRLTLLAAGNDPRLAAHVRACRAASALTALPPARRHCRPTG